MQSHQNLCCTMWCIYSTYHTFYYTFKVWTHIGYDSKHLEAIARKQGAVKGGGGGGRHWRRYFRGGWGEKTVSKARIVSPFPEERWCTVHLKTSRLSVTARPRQFFIRYTQNASYLSSVSISSCASLFRGPSYRRNQKVVSPVTVKMSEGIETFQENMINASSLRVINLHGDWTCLSSSFVMGLVPQHWK